MDKGQYISNIQEGFHRSVDAYLSLVAIAEQQPQVTDYEKRAFEQFKQMLKGKYVREVEKSLSIGDVLKALDQIAKFYKELSDFALEHINERLVWKQVVRQATHQHIDEAKNIEKDRFAAMVDI